MMENKMRRKVMSIQDRIQKKIQDKLQYAYVYTGHTLKLCSLTALEMVADLASRGVKFLHVKATELANDARSDRMVRLEELRAEGLQQIEHKDYPEAEEVLITSDEVPYKNDK